jgi:hypothetical protein
VPVAAGLYQLSPLKDRCLSHCRSPLGFLIHFGGYSGRLCDLRVGLYHGGYCVGCCWGLMVVLVAVGVMNVGWMAGSQPRSFMEKVWRYGKGFRIAFGVALIAFAYFVPSHPGLLPGLHGRHGDRCPHVMLERIGRRAGLRSGTLKRRIRVTASPRVTTVMAGQAGKRGNDRSRRCCQSVCERSNS